MSVSALSAILDKVQSDGVPEDHSRRQFARARDDVVDTPTPYGSIVGSLDVLLADDDGGAELPFLNPIAVLSYLFTHCIAFSTLVLSTLGKRESTFENPWNLVVYTDDITPGNVLAVRLKRKVMGMYVSFLEFGYAVLANENAWLCVAIIHVDTLNGLCSGLSQFVSKFLERVFTGPFSLSNAGVALKRGNEAMIRIFARLGCIVQDGLAHKQTWHTKGDGGTKFCLLCRNVFDRKSGVGDDPDDETDSLLMCSVTSVDQLDIATSEDIFYAARRLEFMQSREGLAEFGRREQALGFRHQPSSILLNRSLDGILNPSEQFCEDWMHGLFVGGAWNTCTFVLFKFLQLNGMPDACDVFFAWLQNWRWPSRVNSTGLAEVFAPKNVKKSTQGKSIKCQAGSGLSLYPVIACWLRIIVVPSGAFNDACETYLALAQVIDLIVSIPRGFVTVRQLRQAEERFLSLFKREFGAEWMHPKFHWIIHYHRFYKQFRILPSCFTHERKHRVVRRYANALLNQVAAKESILREVFCQHVASLSDMAQFDLSIRLLPPLHRTIPAELRRVLESAFDIQGLNASIGSAASCRFSSLGAAQRHDVVFVRSAGDGFVAGHVWAFASVAGRVVSIISIWELNTMHPSKTYAEWNRRDNPIVLDASEIIDTAIWCNISASVVRTLLPSHLRS